MSGPFDRNGVIVDFFKDAWGETTPIQWPNINFKTPGLEKPYVRFIVLEGPEFQGELANVGSRGFKGVGVIIISIFTKLGAGTKEPRELATTIEQIFRATKATGGVRFRAPYSEDIGKTQGWYQFNVTIPFEWWAQY